MTLFLLLAKKIKRKSNLKSRLMSTRKDTKVSVVSEGGTAVQKGGAGVLVNNLYSQDPPASPPLEELDTALAGLLFLLFFFHQQEGYCAQ